MKLRPKLVESRDKLLDSILFIQGVANDLDEILAANDELKPVTRPPAFAPGLANPPAFYNSLRKTKIIGPVITQSEVDGCEAILLACMGWPVSWTAYALATAYHETAHTMQPIVERGVGDTDGDGWDEWFDKYDVGRKAIELGNTPAADGDGHRYRGRGYVQLTGLANYRRAQDKLGLPFVSDPDLALKPDAAAAIMRRGMEEGWFTGKALSAYLQSPATQAQFKNARRVINGTDKADLIASYAITFQDALLAGGYAAK